MNAYVLTSGEYSDYRIHGVFSTREAAAIYLKNFRASADYNRRQRALPRIEEYEMDAINEEQRLVDCFGCEIDFASGETKKLKGKKLLLSGDRDHGYNWLVVAGEATGIQMFSPISQEVADKLAVEQRQHRMRSTEARVG